MSDQPSVAGDRPGIDFFAASHRPIVPASPCPCRPSPVVSGLWSVVPGRRPACAGFTLIEMIVVMAIIALAAVIAIPAMRGGLSGMRLETKGRDLATLCRAARTLAVGEQRPYRIAIEPAQNHIFLVDAYHEKIRDFDLTEEIKLESVKYEGRENHDRIVYVGFYPNGRADEVELTLRNDRGRRVVLKTDLLTGTARLTVPREVGR